MKSKFMKKILLVLLVVFSFVLVKYDNVYAAKTVGKLSIVSDGSTDTAWYGVHSFLLYKNTSKKNQTIAGTTVRPGESITIGTYGNQNNGKGVYVNLEAYYAQYKGAYNNRVSLTTDISSSELKKIKEKIDNCNKWTTTKNCSWFATGVWNTVAPKSKKVSAGFISTPKTLSKNIKKKSSYKKKISLPKYKSVNRYYANGQTKSSSASTKKNSAISSWGN